MIEKIGHIKNPLSVIAIFAAIAEISGTTILPFIEVNNQSIYIWFLMIFPTFLVSAFFLTLNFNNRVLYAPSDYKDENHFVTSFSKANPVEKTKKLQDEIKEVELDENIEATNNVSDKTTVMEAKARKHVIMADVTLAEKLAINKLEKSLGIELKRDMKFSIPFASPKSSNGSLGIIFDAAYITGSSVQAVEVKLFKTKNVDHSRFKNIVNMAEAVATQCEDVSSKSFILHIFAVIDSQELEVDKIKKQLEDSTISSIINTVVHVSTLNDLQSEYLYLT